MAPPNTTTEEQIRNLAHSIVKTIFPWKFVPTTLLNHRINGGEPFHEGYLGSLWVGDVFRTNYAISIKGWIIALVPKEDGIRSCEIYHEDTIYFIGGTAPLTLKPEEFMDFFIDLFAKIFLRQELLRGCERAPQNSEIRSTGQVGYYAYGTAFPEHIFKQISLELQNYQGEGVLEYVPPSRT